jgi:hypothetical protein
MNPINALTLEALALAVPGEVVFVEPGRFEAARVQVVDPDDVERSGILFVAATMAARGCGADAAELTRVTRYAPDGKVVFSTAENLRQLRIVRDDERVMDEVFGG